MNLFLFIAPTFNYESGNNYLPRSKVSRTEMLQWLGYKLPNSGVHDLGLAPRVWLITNCNHCEVTLILQRSPIICDWSNVLSLRYEICYSQHILVKFSLFMFVHTINESRKNQTDQLHFYKFLNFNTKAYDWLIYNYINFLCFYFMKLKPFWGSY